MAYMGVLGCELITDEPKKGVVYTKKTELSQVHML